MLEKWNFAHKLVTTDHISSGLITCSSENIIFNLLLGLFIFFIITLRVYNLTSNIILHELRGCTVMLKIRCMWLVGTASNSVSRKWITNWQAAIPYTVQCNFTSNKLSFAESYAHHPPRQCKERKTSLNNIVFTISHHARNIWCWNLLIILNFFSSY